MSNEIEYSCIYCDKPFSLSVIETHEKDCSYNPDNKKDILNKVSLKEAAKSKESLEKYIGHMLVQAEKFLLLAVPNENGRAELRLIFTPEDPDAKAIWVDFNDLMMDIRKDIGKDETVIKSDKLGNIGVV